MVSEAAQGWAPAPFFNCPAALGEWNPPYRRIVEKIGDFGVVRHKTKAFALEDEAVGERASVMYDDAVRLAAAAGALVAPARGGDIGDELLGTAGEIEEARLDRCGLVSQLGDVDHS